MLKIAADYATELIGNEPGLVLYYKFDEAPSFGNNVMMTPTVNDYSGNNNNGTLTNYALLGCTSNYTCGAPALGGACIVPPITQPTLPVINANCSVTVDTAFTTDACATVSYNGTTNDPFTYSTPGNYTINWTFQDGMGDTVYAPQTVIVNPPATPTITIAEIPAGVYNIAFGGTASASDSYGSNPPADAFDGDTITNGWGNSGNGLPSWLAYDFGAGNPQIVNGYAVYSSSQMQGGWGSVGYVNTAWTFEGFNGTVWDTLDTQVDANPMQDVWKYFYFANTTAYQAYRIYVTNSGSSYCTVTEMQLLQNLPPSICSNKTFVAVANAAAMPATYQWQVNGNNVGTNSNTLTLPVFYLNDVVSCMVTSGNTCVTTNIATSNTVTLTTGAQLFIHNYTVCFGDSVLANGLYFKSDTTFSIAGTSAIGCDSTHQFHIAISNAATTVNGITISANQSGSVYQWLDCNNNNAPIASETNQFYTPSVNGSYAVVVTNGTCVDTSACVSIYSVGINGNAIANSVSVYPNPSSGMFTIESTNRSQVIVTSVLGEIVFNQMMEVGKHNIDLQNQANGVYFVKVISNNKQQMIKLIKEQ